jgi:5-oxopent-3-ene-1,2,5-tricarboxylate decarboxylase/2-hydroxyhepta-2,4-diene-1,7-dioate isomerase
MIIGVALNFASEISGLADPPKAPVLFIKPENTLTSHLSPVLHPDGVPAIQPGPSLAVVIGRRARRVDRSEAFDFVKGYTLFNDFSLKETSHFRPPVRTKCFDSFGPLGPTVVSRSAIRDPHDVTLRCLVNGDGRQQGTTRDLVWKIPELIELITSFMTLDEDDAVAIGVPPGRVDVVAGDSVTVEADGFPSLTSHVVTEREYRNSSTPLPPPRQPTFLALGLNYADHASELRFQAPGEPLLFLKAPGSLTGHNQVCCRPDGVEMMHYEGELVVVIGRTASQVKRSEAMDYVFGYTIANDYAVRDYLENYYRPNLRVKSRDGLTPLGPCIVEKNDVSDPQALEIRTYVNGELRQQGNTRDMVFDIPFLLEYVTSFMTLRPFDMISTGTPKGLSNVMPGDEVVVEIESLGRLSNRIVSEKEWRSLHE